MNEQRAVRPHGPIADRRMATGAELRPDGTHFRLWAPAAREVRVMLAQDRSHALEPEPDGYFSGLVPGVGRGALYGFSLDGGPCRPDPVSRFQPQGPLGPSMVIDPDRYAWQDTGWNGAPRTGQVVYELHVGTFTPDGTYRAAIEKLQHLVDIGITLIELMPVASFAGEFGWGYDGVALFAPHHVYGEPDDLRAFVDAAHGHGLAVIMDVVYNHLGPVGNFMPEMAPQFFTDRYVNDWGKAPDYESDHARPVRDFVVQNACYWIDEFHMDGLRLDATQNIYDFDESHEHILAELTRKARETAGDRPIWIVAENEPQVTRLARPREKGGYGLDAMWNDDFHHAARVALGGRNEAYLTDYRGRAQEFVAAVRHGFLYQGQRYRWQDMPRGHACRDLDPEQLVCFLMNHDQVANSGRGWPMSKIAAPGQMRAMTALLLLGPWTPMLFQGQEWASSAPFQYFAELTPDLAEPVLEGRRGTVGQFPSLATPPMQAIVPLPSSRTTFNACKLDWGECQRHDQMRSLHRDLIRLRKHDPALLAARAARDGVDAAVLDTYAFVVRFYGSDGDDRLLVVNLGVDLELAIMPEPLLAPPEGTDWALQWSSEHPDYGGTGLQPPHADAAWIVAGHSAMLLRPGPASAKRIGEHEKALREAARHRANAARSEAEPADAPTAAGQGSAE